MMNTQFSRRNLFRLRLGDWMALVREQEEDREVRPYRPPGALPDESDFLATCQRCGACARACPYGVIHPMGPIAGRAEGTPEMHPEQNPCRWCTDFPCIGACPSGALSRDPRRLAMGTARLAPEHCLNHRGILCDTCVQVCPRPLQAITLHQREPRLDPDRCTGCGLCAFHCEAEPTAFALLPRARHGARDEEAMERPTSNRQSG